VNRREFLAASYPRFQDCREFTSHLPHDGPVERHNAPSEKLPDNLNNIDYDRYRVYISTRRRYHG